MCGQGVKIAMQTLQTLANRLRDEPKSADQLWQDNQEIWQQLGWSKTQVALWQASLPQMHCDEVAASYQVKPDITAHIEKLLTQAGRPQPIALLLKKLPSGVTATEQQLRKLAQQSDRLEVKGPLLRLKD